MANIKSQKKRNKTNAKAYARNKSVKAELRTRVKQADAAIGAGDGDADAVDDAVRTAVKRIDMAAAKGIIHKNAAARKKSRLARRANAAATTTD